MTYYELRPETVEAEQYTGAALVAGMCAGGQPDCLPGPHIHRGMDGAVQRVPVGYYIQRVPNRRLLVPDPDYDNWRLWTAEAFERLYRRVEATP